MTDAELIRALAPLVKRYLDKAAASAALDGIKYPDLHAELLAAADRLELLESVLYHVESEAQEMVRMSDRAEEMSNDRTPYGEAGYVPENVRSVFDGKTRAYRQASKMIFKHTGKAARED